MRRSRLASPALPHAPILLGIALLGLALSLPAAARAAPLMGANGESAECPDVVAGADEDVAETAPVAKPAAAKRGASPAGNKSRPATRGNGNAPVRGPRWHRFLPGMFR